MSDKAAVGGPGGYAGIHVPSYIGKTGDELNYVIGYNKSDGSKHVIHYNPSAATLNLKGNGILIAYGGNAGKGGNGYGHPHGGGRRWSEQEQVLEEMVVPVVMVQDGHYLKKL